MTLTYDHKTEGAITWVAGRRLRLAIATLPFVRELVIHGEHLPDDILLIGYASNGQRLTRVWFILDAAVKLDIMPGGTCIGQRVPPHAMRSKLRGVGCPIYYRRVPSWARHVILTRGFNQRGLKCFYILHRWRLLKRRATSYSVRLGRRAFFGLGAAWQFVREQVTRNRPSARS